MRLKNLSLFVILTIFASFVCLINLTNAADLNTTQGLSISPVNSFTNISAGQSQVNTIEIGDYTTQPLNINLFIKSFRVVNYNYNYQFTNTINNWIKISQTEVNLRPGEYTGVDYTIKIPANTSAGGYYYAIFASATVPQASLNVSLQAVSIVYLTIKGKLIETSNLVSNSISHLIFGKTINYEINIKNTGNVNYFIYLNTRLRGYMLRPSQTQVAHLLLPNTIRTVDGAILSPYLPGIYKVDYGYRTDSGAQVKLSSYVVFIPPWSIATVVLILMIVFYISEHRKNRPKKFKL